MYTLYVHVYVLAVCSLVTQVKSLEGKIAKFGPDIFQKVSSCCTLYQTHELIPPCDARRREKVGALYSAISGLLVVISRAHPQSLSHAPQNYIP